MAGDQQNDHLRLVDHFENCCWTEHRRCPDSMLARFTTLIYVAKQSGDFSEKCSPATRVARYIESILLGAHTHHNDIRCEDLAKLRLFYNRPQNSRQIIASVRQFCASEALKPLQAQFLDLQTQQQADDSTRVDDLDVAPRKQDKADALLYRSLRAQRHCSSRFGHEGYLQLDSLANDPGPTIYHTAFRRCVEAESGGLDWARLRFEVPPTVRPGWKDDVKAKSPKIGIASASPGSSGARPEEIHLCAFLKQGFGVAYRVVEATSERLLDLKRRHRADSGIERGAVVPLSDLLLKYELSPIAKICLAHALINAVWRYYASDWMHQRWKTDNIYFMRSSDKTGQYGDCPHDPLSPHIEMCLEPPMYPPDLNSSEYWPEDVLHCAPRIFALGVTLVEIFWGPLGSFYGDQFTVESDIFCACLSKIQGSAEDFPLALESSELKEGLHAILAACFDDPRDLQDSLESRRAHLLLKVVLPMNRLVQNGGINPPQMGKSIRWDSRSLESIQDLSVALGHGTGQLNSARHIATSSDWLDALISSRLASDVRREMRSARGGPASPRRIKIAVLDTGYDPKIAFFAGRNRIVWKDFVSPPSNTPMDESRDGHGTMCLSIVAQLAPWADLLVARIATDREGFSGSAARLTIDQIRQALNWANAQGADVVTMSFGFDNDQEALRSTIEDIVTRRNHKILLFAAASNAGANVRREDFPARHPHVFAVHSTGFEGYPSRFNTTPGSFDAGTIATLGEDVPAFRSRLAARGEETVCKATGTSFACPIAAAIAAMILAATVIVEHQAGQDLFYITGMRSMLQLPDCGQEIGDHRYVFPSAFFDASSERRLAVMQYISRANHH